MSVLPTNCMLQLSSRNNLKIESTAMFSYFFKAISLREARRSVTGNTNGPHTSPEVHVSRRSDRHVTIHIII
jgi:hypothetical protein